MFKYPTTHGGAVDLFKQFNDRVIEDLPPSTLEEEQDVVMEMIYWVMFIIMWCVMFIGDVWDMV